MNKRLLYTPLLLLAPCLMANSPAPFAATDNYTLVSVSNFSESGNIISFDLTNGGNKYVCEGSTMAPIYGYLMRDDGYQYVCNCRPVDQLFENQGLAPGMTARYQFEFDGVIDYSRITQFSTYALTTIDEHATYTNPTFTKTGDKVYTFNAEITGKGDYYYTTVVDVTYNGKDYCFCYSDWYTKGNEIETAEELDLSKLEIKSVKFFRSNYNTYKGSYSGPDSNQQHTENSNNYVGDPNKNVTSNNNNNAKNGQGVKGNVATDPTVPLLVALVVVGGIAVVAAPIVISLIVSKKKK